MNPSGLAPRKTRFSAITGSRSAPGRSLLQTPPATWACQSGWRARSAEGTQQHPSKRLCRAQRDRPGRDPRRDSAEAPEEGRPLRPGLRLAPTPCAEPREAGAVTLEPTPAQPAAAPTLAFQHCRGPVTCPTRPLPQPPLRPRPGRLGWVLGCQQAPPSLHLPFRVPRHLLNSLKMTTGFCVRTGPCPKHLVFRRPRDRRILGPGALPAPTQRAAWAPRLPLAQPVG